MIVRVVMVVNSYFIPSPFILAFPIHIIFSYNYTVGDVYLIKFDKIIKGAV